MQSLERNASPKIDTSRAKPHGVGRIAQLAMVLALACVVTACQRSQGGSTVDAPTSALPSGGTIAMIPAGDLAGSAQSTVAGSEPNPYHGNVEAVAQGKVLFVKMNCAGCHGYTAKGAMGPDLTDTYWRYGGTPAAIYKSIYEGRPQGMPAWGRALQARDIWMLVAYVQSLGGSFPASDYQASLQGDVPGEMVAPEVKSTSTQTDDAKAAAMAAMPSNSPPSAPVPPADASNAASSVAPSTPPPQTPSAK